ncbi:MAG: sensor histidine kinase [Lachnospiraceae bacterium]|nr:sensor histidine kinase [Lachnospiraceae bacterium]
MKQKTKDYKIRTENGKIRLSLSALFTILVTALVTFTLSIAVIIFVNIYQNLVEENAVTISEQAVVQAKNTVTNYTEDMSDVMDMITENIGGDSQNVTRNLYNIFDARNELIAVTIYNQKGKRLNSWAKGKIYKETISEDLTYMDISEADDSLHISSPHVESMFQNDYPWVVTLGRNVATKQYGKVLVCMDIRFSQIASYIDDVGIGNHGYCYIADDEGNIIYHPQQQLIYSGLKEEENPNFSDGTHIRTNAIYTVQSLDSCNWKIVGVCYVDEMITNRIQAIFRVLIIILFVVLFSAFLSGFTISRQLSKPVKRLTSAMEEFEGDAKITAFQDMDGTREIVSLSESFTQMASRIQRLMEQIRQEEISLRKTELSALQAQINPHFLYNTLDSIAWMCEEGRNDDAEEMVNALARLFRISISKGHELIPIEKELQHAKSYLQIQNYRYKNQFTYEFDVEESCYPYLCNKITLQPIIENAIYHGIDRMVDEGEIRVSIKEDGENIVFKVEDNGIGMTKEQCEEILSHDVSGKFGIGIKNVNDRIQIYFGEEYGLTIESELDEGTCVTIVMPKITEELYEGRA